jgi:hypothetical protein
MHQVLSANGWDAMRWERLRVIDPRHRAWNMHVLDTSARASREVADQVLAWCRRALRGQTPQIRVADLSPR